MNKILRAVIVTLVILAITGITGAAVYALGQNTSVTSAILGNAGRGPGFGEGNGQGQGRGRIEGQRPAPPAGAQPGNFPPRGFEGEGEHGGEGGAGLNISLFTLMGLARNIGLVAAITFVIVVFQKLIKLIFKRKPEQTTSA